VLALIKLVDLIFRAQFHIELKHLTSYLLKHTGLSPLIPQKVTFISVFNNGSGDPMYLGGLTVKSGCVIANV